MLTQRVTPSSRPYNKSRYLGGGTVNIIGGDEWGPGRKSYGGELKKGKKRAGRKGETRHLGKTKSLPRMNMPEGTIVTGAGVLLPTGEQISMAEATQRFAQPAGQPQLGGGERVTTAQPPSGVSPGLLRRGIGGVASNPNIAADYVPGPGRSARKARSLGKPEEPTPEQQALEGVEEAKQKQEASKEAALGYFEGLDTGMPKGFQEELQRSKEAQLGYYQPVQEALGEMPEQIEQATQVALGGFEPIKESLAGMGDLISPEQRARMETERRAQLGAYGQNLMGMYTDPYSGVQGAQRRDIARGIAGQQANLPIELDLQMAQANRQAEMQRLGALGDVAGSMGNIALQEPSSLLGAYGAQAGVAGQMAGVEKGWQGLQAQLGQMEAGRQFDIAQAKSGIQQSYQYDPGLEYLEKLGYGQGYQQQMGATPQPQSQPAPQPTQPAPQPPQQTQPVPQTQKRRRKKPTLGGGTINVGPQRKESRGIW